MKPRAFSTIRRCAARWSKSNRRRILGSTRSRPMPSCRQAGMRRRPARRSSASNDSLMTGATKLVALQVLYRLPHAQRRLTYQAVDDLREAMKRPPWLLQPPDIWRAYKRLSADKVRGNPAGTLADIVMLVRYAIGEAETLEPLPALVAGRFNLWLGREEKAGASIPTSSGLGSPRSATTSRSMSRRRRAISTTRPNSPRGAASSERRSCSARDCRGCWRS